jgi:nicotinic acid mononucleotide adenylyltransferase
MKDLVVCVSGTFSPPHRGHIRMGIESAESLKKLGRKVRAVVFIPVHDNYLRNKVTSGNEDIAFSSEQRVKLLQHLIDKEPNDVKCIAIDWESESKHLLTNSPAYWAKKLPGGYLKTIPTSKLLPAFQNTWVHTKFGKNTKAAWVVGMDNLEYMPTWNNVESIFRNSDLILMCRPKSNGDDQNVVNLRSDPTSLLSSFSTVHISSMASLKVYYNNKILFGHEPETKIGQGTSEMFVVEKLRGGKHLSLCSSSKVRNAMRTLRFHGYFSSENDLKALLMYKNRSWADIQNGEDIVVPESTAATTTTKKKCGWNVSRLGVTAIFMAIFFLNASVKK